MTKPYEAPDMLELGDARELTLGQNGDCNDNCACHVKPRAGELELT